METTTTSNDDGQMDAPSTSPGSSVSSTARLRDGNGDDDAAYLDRLLSERKVAESTAGLDCTLKLINAGKSGVLSASARPAARRETKGGSPIRATGTRIGRGMRRLFIIPLNRAGTRRECQRAPHPGRNSFDEWWRLFSGPFPHPLHPLRLSATRRDGCCASPTKRAARVLSLSGERARGSIILDVLYRSRRDLSFAFFPFVRACATAAPLRFSLPGARFDFQSAFHGRFDRRAGLHAKSFAARQRRRPRERARRLFT